MSQIEKFSRAGSYHRENRIGNQDHLKSASGRRYRVVTLADGVSTCPRAGEGAQLAANAATELYAKKADYFLLYDPAKISELTVDHVLYRLRERAEADNADVEDYSSTLSSVVYDGTAGKLLYFHLGDGLILGLRPGRLETIAGPGEGGEAGCCVTTTLNAAADARAGVIDAGDLGAVMLLSDGAWREMYDGRFLRPELRDALLAGDYEALRTFLTQTDPFDDASFILMML